ncbi:divergent polysaccharide deacetylase family protein [Parvularcula sp. LCG005]|uniref:divergent polysaccharide deacetylase family protein n=1 Tax=Parvularcula sp. LCG005 TaxID=3078805 RepID=UPI002941ECD0|nr:divergent polysaccharide deacetylase family protein [Parvularcula sp. LCG005]WOI53100.1 divergent polysaccharide deacetylase family protein [Parvularcula sp. LCG005]
MSRKRPLVLSRLMKAWIALGATVLLGLIVVLVLPTPAPPQAEIIVDVPEEADRYAGADPLAGAGAMAGDDPAADGREPPSMRVPTPAVPDEDIPLSPEDALDLAGPDAVIITVPGDGGASRPARGTTRLPPLSARSDMVATTAQGRKPKLGPAGETPFETYRHLAALNGKPGIALLVSGLGPDEELARRAINDLPAEVSLSFVPYTKNLDVLLTEAVAAGHEVVIEIPMEQSSVPLDSLGPAALSTERAVDANVKRLEWILSRAPAYPMVTNYLGGTFSTQPAAIGPVLSTIKSSGLGYIDDTGMAGAIAQRMQLPYAAVALVIPPGQSGLYARLDGMLANGPTGPKPPLVKIYAGDGGLDDLKAWIDAPSTPAHQVLPASSALSQGKS